MSRIEQSPSFGWMVVGGNRFLRALETMSEQELSRPSALPGWTNKHLVAHVHFNAQALRRLVSWAQTGRPTPMYENLSQRSQEIHSGATLAGSELRALVAKSQQLLHDELAALTDDESSREVVTIQGRTIQAAEIPWLRAREVCVHAVDLSPTTTFSDFPGDFNLALAFDVLSKRASGGELPLILDWLTGRDVVAPSLGPWL